MSNTGCQGSLILISSNPKDIAFCGDVARAAGLELKRFDTIDETIDLLSSGKCIALFADIRDEPSYRSIERVLLQSTAGQSLPPEAIHFIACQPMEHLPYLLERRTYFNFIMRCSGQPSDAGQLYGRLLRMTFLGVSTELSELLGGGAHIHTIDVCRSKDKATAINSVLHLAEEAGFIPRIAFEVIGSVDEFLMNAIFDAPVDDSGNYLLETAPRTTEITLNGRNSVSMQAGFNGDYAAILVSDQYGSLKPERVIEKLARNYAKDEYQLNERKAGAGLGIFTVFHGGASVVYRVSEGKRTDALALFRKSISFREFKDGYRFFMLRSDHQGQAELT